MSPRKPKPPVDIIVEVQTADEAINYMFAGFKFFLVHHTAKTLLALLLICGSTLYVVFDYYTSTKSKVSKISDVGSSKTFSIMPQAFAEPGGGLPIVIEGKTLSVQYDPDFEVWKEFGSENFIVYQKSNHRVIRVEPRPWLEQYKSLK